MNFPKKNSNFVPVCPENENKVAGWKQTTKKETSPMSVDILPPKFSQIPTAFTYPHLQQMKEARAPSPFVVHGRVKIDDANTKVNINNFDPNYIVYDPTSDTTYIRGRLLGKVSRLIFP